MTWSSDVCSSDLIVYLLGWDDFPRVRVGIGRPAEGWDMKD